MSKGSIITLVVLVVAIVGGLLIYKDRRAAATNIEARAAATEYVQSRKVFNEHGEYIEGLIERFHDEAFEKAYVHGGLFATSEYDEHDYFEELWFLARRTAREEGRSEVADMLPGAGDDERPLPPKKSPAPTD